MFRYFKIVFSGWVLILFASLQLSAQSPMPINIENLTDQQVIMLMSQYQLFGLSDLEMELKAREKGMSPDQFTQLKKRMALLDPAQLKEINSPAKAQNDLYESRTAPLINNRARNLAASDTSKGLKVFGASIFENESLSFEPNLNIPTPQGYIIGAGDQLVIDVFGVSDLTKKLKVNAEGDIRFPNLGPIKVVGMNVEDASVKIKRALSKIYPGINNGSVAVQVAVGQIRSIRVSLIGEIRYPGNYDLSSMSTIMNALYTSGGPNQIGSFRNIELVRGGKVKLVFDMYDFLLRSDLTKNALLQDGDVIRVNPYQTRVALKGAVKKPALFDVKPGESAADLLKYAGGFADIGYKELIRVFRFGARNKELITVKAAQLPAFKLVSGDTLVVDTLANIFENRASIAGAVYYPGAYGIEQMPSLKDLLEAARPRSDAFMDRALLRRLKADLTPEFINFNIGEVLAGKTKIALLREDSVIIYHVSDLREKYFVTINGEVNKPGTFEFSENMTVQDLVLLARGYKDGASLQKIEISRRLRPDVVSSNVNVAGTGSAPQKDSALYSVIKEIDLSKSVADQDFRLMAFDIVAVRRSPLYKEQITATIEGEVIYPGNYTLAGNAERISDLVKRAGGLKQKGFAGGAVLIRKTYRDISESDATVVNNKTNLINLQSGKGAAVASNDTSTIRQLNKEQKAVGIRLDKILEHPGAADDLFLLEGDVLKVPRESQTIQTFGAVNVPKQIVYHEGISFREALIESGRYSVNASRKNAYVIYPNGQVRKTRNFLGIRSYPEIRPGTEIYVPEKRGRQKLTIGEIAGVFSSLTALVSVLIVLTK